MRAKYEYEYKPSGTGTYNAPVAGDAVLARDWLSPEDEKAWSTL